MTGSVLGEIAPWIEEAKSRYCSITFGVIEEGGRGLARGVIGGPGPSVIASSITAGVGEGHAA